MSIMHTTVSGRVLHPKSSTLWLTTHLGSAEAWEQQGSTTGSLALRATHTRLQITAAVWYVSLSSSD